MKHQGKNDASVIVCTYTAQRWTLLQRAVASVLAQGDRVREIIVIVDHDTELLENIRHHWFDARVSVSANVFAQGLSGARNSGVALATSDVVAFLDDDAQAQDGWIGCLLSAYEDERVVGCGGGVEADDHGRRPEWWPPEFDWVVGCSYLGMPSKRAVVRNFIGANMSFKTQSLLAAGGFADGMGRLGTDASGCEETDLCIRLAALDAGARIVYDPAARVRHAVGADRLTWRYFKARCYAEGRSKAQVAKRLGSRRALSSEQTYTRRVLPRGIARSLFGGRGGPRRAAAIVAGLALTTAGYLRGRLANPTVQLQPDGVQWASPSTSRVSVTRVV